MVKRPGNCYPDRQAVPTLLDTKRVQRENAEMSKAILSYRGQESNTVFWDIPDLSPITYNIFGSCLEKWAILKLCLNTNNHNGIIFSRN